jgi:hypothetical protein
MAFSFAQDGKTQNKPNREKNMDVRIDSKTADPISLNTAVEKIKTQLDQQPSQWLDELSNDPTHFAQLEQQVHLAFSQLADQLVAGLLAQASQKPSVQTAKKKSQPKRINHSARRKNAH